MSIKAREIIKYMEELAPNSLAEDYDNVGLLVGSRESIVERILVCLDVTSKIVDEAIAKKADLIVSHHPVIFKGLKRINEDDPKGSIIYRLIKNSIGVYSAHTNLDVACGGVNDYLSSVLGLTKIANLKDYRAEKLYKIVVFVPHESVDSVRDAMSRAGAGWIGNYSDCSFMTAGTGTFRPLEGTNPYIGTTGNLEKVDEYRLETIVSQKDLKKAIEAMVKAHPYEEVAYDIYPLEIKGRQYGMGNVGALDIPKSLEEFVAVVKEKLGVKNVRVIGGINREIKKVAVFCGSFDREVMEAAKSKADVLVTGDVKYHDAVDMLEMEMCVIDAGHFNTERIIADRLFELIKENFPQIEVMKSNMEEDPFKFC
ncbi:MAG TPA: Nif3-like dinuclear metal center hexameric protein [Acetivibrio sp.]|uniref:Nif3-like dinuclear metal center hexameric protein n=1 Tax=Acetivibrio sp. TaxID=1872092 RepID=UPI002C4255CD|nr:Nif3-like dinuclear metal center hexameric protein [Acetivibrio sp.]HOM03833.1 Nif3-like dinuclear metal center hexameric protein [Acetivibrio sp.]